MKKILIASLTSLLASLTAHAQQGESMPAPATSTPAQSLEQNVLDEQTVDFFIPVITLEQFYSGQTRLQGYRIQIYKDGRGIYHGLKNVKTIGEVRFNIEREQVQKIFAEFEKYKFWRVPEDQYGIPKGFAPLSLSFTLRIGSASRTVRFSGQNHGGMLQKVIENEVRSAQWRCPHVDDRNIELCASRERYVSYSISDFLNQDLPKLTEAYK